MKKILLKFLGLLSLVKVQNVMALLLAQFIMAHIIYCPKCQILKLLLNQKFILFLFSTATAISAGYIINNFYNLKRDLINRPAKTGLEQQIQTNKKLYLYFALNFLSVISGLFISWRAALFFSFFIFLIWIYSHKLQHKALIHEMANVLLILFPFFGIMLFFKQVNSFLILTGILVAFILFIKELIKNFLTLPGDFAQQIETVLTRYGEKKLNILFYISLLSAYFVSTALYLQTKETRFPFFIILLWIILGIIMALFKKKKYFQAYQIIKLLIVSGIFSLYLLKLNVT